MSFATSAEDEGACKYDVYLSCFVYLVVLAYLIAYRYHHYYLYYT